MTYKEFWKKHHNKIIGGAAFVAGLVFAYEIGSTHLIDRLQGKTCLITAKYDGVFMKKLKKFVDPTLNIPTYTNLNMSVPRDEVVKLVKKSVKTLPEDQKTVNVFMTSIKGQ